MTIKDLEERNPWFITKEVVAAGGIDNFLDDNLKNLLMTLKLIG